jgi:hypothetical protein
MKRHMVRVARLVLAAGCLVVIILGSVEGVGWLAAGAFGVAFVGLATVPRLVDYVVKFVLRHEGRAG